MLAMPVLPVIAAALGLLDAPRARQIPTLPLEALALHALLVMFLVLVLLSARPSARLVLTCPTDSARTALLDRTRRPVLRLALPARLVLSPTRMVLLPARLALLVPHLPGAPVLAWLSTARLESTLATVPARPAQVECTAVLTRRLAPLARPTRSPLVALHLALLAHLEPLACLGLLSALALARLVNI